MYKGVDLSTDPLRTVAIKILSTEEKYESWLKVFFEKEVESLITLEHPGILRIWDYGTTEDGKFFLILEWMERDLHTWIEETHGINWQTFLTQLGLPIIEALAYAHERQVIHRDIKPQNILLDENDCPKLADFGISKIKNDFKPSYETTIDFSSRPFAPPEKDSTAARDVFAFGVLLITALAGEYPSDYPEIELLLQKIECPDELRAIVKECVELSSAKRPRNANIVLEQIRLLVEKYELNHRENRTVLLDITRAVRDQISTFKSINQLDVNKFIVDDLNKRALLRDASEDIPFGQSIDRRIFIGGEEFSYGSKITLDKDSKHGRITLMGVRAYNDGAETRAENVDLRLREYTFTHSANSLSPKSSRDSIERLIQDLEVHNESRNQLAISEQSRKLIEQWKAQISLRESIEKNRENPINYSRYSIDNQRITFQVTDDPHEIKVGEYRRAVNGAGWVTRSFEIESVQDESVTGYFEVKPENIPLRGQIKLDNSAAQIKIDRERRALNSLIHESSDLVNPVLKEIVLDPSAQKHFPNQDIEKWHIENLDLEKREIIKAALGNQGMFVVEGPPGTGKTTLIAELVAQQLRIKPNSKILISSQTNVALDNAIERIAKIVDRNRVIRLADPNNSKVAESMSEFLLKNQVERWREKVVSTSLNNFKKWCEDREIDHVKVVSASKINQLALLIEIQLDKKRALVKLSEEFDLNIGRMSPTEREETEESIRTYKKDIKKIERDRRQIISELQIAKVEIDELLNEPAKLRSLAEEVLLPLGGDRRFVDVHVSWNQLLNVSGQFDEAVIYNSQVMGGTCIGIAKWYANFADLRFDLCIVDEASKATVTESLVPLIRSRKWVLVGDERQLPPFVDEAMKNRSLLDEFSVNSHELSQTLFGRMVEELPEHSRAKLVTQRRMCTAIGELVSNCFYDGKLISEGPEPFDKFEDLLPKPVTWWDTSGLSDREENFNKTSLKVSNICEVRVIRKLLERIIHLSEEKSFDVSSSILLITPYQAQVSQLERMLTLLPKSSLEIRVSTVDAVQGREADLVVFSTVRSNTENRVGFLDEDRRANVALSRARRGLIVVGDAEFLSNADSPFREVISFIRLNNAYGEIRGVEL